MNYSRWATIEELKERLTEVKVNGKVEKSGIPMLSEGDNLYVKNDESHSMIIGATGSGKTQTTVLPQLKLAVKAGESFVLNDTKGEIYEILKEDLEKEKYNVAVINLLDASNSNNLNLLALPYKLYKNGKKDQAVDILESISNYFFADDTFNPNADPFWRNSAVSLFIGLILYAFEKEENEVTLNTIARLSTDLDTIEAEVKTTFKNTLIDSYLSSILLAPNETKGSIVSVFTQYIKLFITRESLNKIMSNTNIDIENIQKNKTALFIISDNKAYAKRLIPAIIEECYHASIITNDKSRRLNILIDDFESLVAIKDFVNTLSIARSYNIKFNIYIKSFLELKNTYGTETTELLKISFSNIIYLLANDVSTLEDISKMCGNKKVNEPLVTPEELKLLDNFEAIILMPRIYPIRTKLVPNYKINW